MVDECLDVFFCIEPRNAGFARKLNRLPGRTEWRKPRREKHAFQVPIFRFRQRDDESCNRFPLDANPVLMSHTSTRFGGKWVESVVGRIGAQSEREHRGS